MLARTLSSCRTAFKFGNGLARRTRNLVHLRESRVFVGQRETVDAPGFRVWIDFGPFYKSVADLKTLTTTDANYLVAIGPGQTTIPDLLVNRCIGLASNLPVIESVTPKPCWQRLIGTAFFTPSLRRSARLWDR
jgi:hypothetical protein